mmetsp:Transcript_11826/g.16046  ORF Transcript_11826/g.16046 Transcript_11826/m.16046 type:complete len:125 (+) Transcript_11826:1264-1638(+)|eukprot:CAMPEP_0197290718 /NCGR_PEP_ID=MMETSP0890-20130614/9428_1 /TAXON_ID=44058 ORGANISM="Aureoumbra lagunensis, Strain CCMP1510" /NCGR_SAMPLE_ID=MMETSP0890 /ASSEMBLY_ACC=CAM_ASM_000533 /LENGTH=124 /DNA_ID=CAMNT_0042762939 /DNA_START=58 /DNA_END=432 /DNA_ORIENTATION=-
MDTRPKDMQYKGKVSRVVRHSFYCTTCRNRLQQNPNFYCDARGELPIFGDDDDWSTDEELSSFGDEKRYENGYKSDSTFEIIDDDDLADDYMQLPTLPEGTALGEFVVLAPAPTLRITSEEIAP